MQTKNKTIDDITELIEQMGFNYDLTEEDGNSKTDYFRSVNLRFMMCRVTEPLSIDSPNIILIDAKMEILKYDPTTPSSTNTILQGRFYHDELENVLATMRIAEKTIRV